MSESRLISIPVIPRKLSETAVRELLDKIRHNLQVIEKLGLPQATFNRQYGQIVSSTVGATGIPKASASPSSKTPPTPKNLTISEGYTTISLSWFMKNDNWTHFQIFRSATSSIDDAILIGSATTTSFSDAPPAADKLYYYWVRPVNGVTLGPLTGPISGQVEHVGYGDGVAPSEPQNIRAIGGIRQIHVQWSASISNDVIYYEVFRSDQALGKADVLDLAESLGKTGSTFWDDRLDAGDSTTYYYWVRAIDVEDLVSVLDSSPTQRSAAAITADTIDITDSATTKVLAATDDDLDLSGDDTWAASTAQVTTEDPCNGNWGIVFVNAYGLWLGGATKKASVRLHEENLTSSTESWEAGGVWKAEDGYSAPISWVFLRSIDPTKEYRWTPEFKYDTVYTGPGNEEISGIEVLAMVVKR